MAVEARAAEEEDGTVTVVVTEAAEAEAVALQRWVEEASERGALPGWAHPPLVLGHSRHTEQRTALPPSGMLPSLVSLAEDS